MSRIAWAAGSLDDRVTRLDCDRLMLPEVSCDAARGYLAVSPLATVPTFVEKGLVMKESSACDPHVAAIVSPRPCHAASRRWA
jgi:glutathione S-transferase